MKLNNTEIYVLKSGTIKLPDIFMYGFHSKKPIDAYSIIPINTIVVKTTDYTLLIDPGPGPVEQLPKGIVKHYEPTYTLIEELQKLNIKPEDITHILLSHLHFDHMGSVFTYKNGNITPTFPNANIILHIDSIPDEKLSPPIDKGSYLEDKIKALRNYSKTTYLTGSSWEDIQVLPYITTRITYGHSAATLITKIKLNNKTFVYASDVIPTSQHLHKYIYSLYDNCIHKNYTFKIHLLREWIDKDAILIYPHDPKMVASSFKLIGDEDYEAYNTIAKF